MLIQNHFFRFALSFFAVVAFNNLAIAEAKLPLPRHADVYVVAHRGAHDGIPENTLAAYSRAIELGCDFVEIDMRTTKDGHLVSVHDATIDAYAPGQSGKVKEMTLAELRALDIGSRVHERWRQERIPTLEEILALCKGKIGIYLDMKDAQTDSVLRAVRAHGMENSCIWYASPRQLLEVAARCPECLVMPDPGPEKFLPRMLKHFKPSVVASSFEQLSKAFVDDCHAAGALVIVDESDASSWKTMLEWGVDGIQTDDPAGLITFLHGQQRRN